MQLFRPEAMREPEYGEALAFAVPPWRTFGLVAAAAVALLTLFAFFADFDRTATAPGMLVPASGIARMTTPQAGTVTAVLVRQGAQVGKGQAVARVAAISLLPNGAPVPQQMLETYRQQQRLTGEQLAAQRAQTAAERNQLIQQEAQLAATGQSLQSQISFQQQRVAKNQERLAKLGPLHDKGYISDPAYLAVEDAVLSGGQQLAVLQQNQATNVHELDRVRLRIAELDAAARQTILQSQSTQLALERGAAGAQGAAEVTVAAPIAGEVTSLRIARGQMVRADEEIGAVITPGDRMEALLLIPPESAGALHKGQDVTIRFNAFPYQRFGLGRGRVSQVASSAAPEPSAGGALRYRVLVALTEPPPHVPVELLKPDLTLSASIVVERRSLLDWLFAPLREEWHEGLRRRQG